MTSNKHFFRLSCIEVQSWSIYIQYIVSELRYPAFIPTSIIDPARLMENRYESIVSIVYFHCHIDPVYPPLYRAFRKCSLPHIGRLTSYYERLSGRSNYGRGCISIFRDGFASQIVIREYSQRLYICSGRRVQSVDRQLALSTPPTDPRTKQALFHLPDAHLHYSSTFHSHLFN